MPNHKSCKKRLKTSEKSRIYNKAYYSCLCHGIKKFRAIENGEEATAAVPVLSSLLDKMAQKGILKRKKADRLKSRLQQGANRLS